MSRARVRMALGTATALLVLAGPAGAHAQESGDTLRLGELQEAAVRLDARAEQLDLIASQGELRLRNIAAERLPSLSLQGQAQYQSDVINLPFQPPGGGSPPVPPKDTYDAHLSARQSLYDPSTGARRAVERARVAEQQAAVGVDLYELKQGVNDAYFGLLLLQAQGDEIEVALEDLEARLQLSRAREREGAALPSEAATLQAELLRRRQALDQIDAEREAARRVLADLTGRRIGDGDVLTLPSLAPLAARARAEMGEQRARPEYERFRRGRELLQRQQAALSASERPRLSAFGRAGYGRPGLDPLALEFDSYWLGGVQVEWAPWRWGSSDREREVLALQARILETQEAAFTAGLQRTALREEANLDRLERTVASDAEIISLRESILNETRLRFDEGVVTSAEYVDRETDLLDARLSARLHAVELAHARARLLTLLGVDLP